MREPLLDEGDVLLVRFEAFTVRLTFSAGASPDIEKVAGDNAGFEDIVAYGESAIGADIVAIF